MYALGSAAVVHTVAQKCVDINLPDCGCNSNLSNDTVSPDETWECSPNIEFGIKLARKLLDEREDNATEQHKTFVLHNSKIGRMVSR